MNRLALLFTLAVFISVFTAVGHAKNIADDYKTKVLADVNSTQLLSTDIRDGIRTSCPTVKSKDISSCFRALIRNLEIRSANHMLSVAAIGTSAVQIDKFAGYDETTANLFLLDNLLLVMERTNIANFHLTKMKYRDPDDYVGLVFLRQEEEKSLQKAKEQLILTIREKFMEVKAGLVATANATATQKWQTAFFERIKPRAMAAESRPYKFPAPDLVLRREIVANLNLNAKLKFICLHPRITACKKFSITMCDSMTKETYGACAKNADNRTPASLPDGHSANTYIRSINDCASPRWKKAFVNVVPSCAETLKEDPFQKFGI